MTWNEYLVSLRQGVQSQFDKRPMQGATILPPKDHDVGTPPNSPCTNSEKESNPNVGRLSSWMKPVDDENEILWMLEEG